MNFGNAGTAAVTNVQSLISILTTTNTISLSQNSGFIGAPANPLEGQQGGGVWARGLNGSFDTTSSGSYTYANVGGFFPPGGGSCRTRTFQDYTGVQAGADIVRLNIDGFNMHLGLTAGYLESSARSGDPGSTARAGFQSTFGGVYGALTKGTFFADAQLRWDFYQGDVSDLNSGIGGQRLDARSVSIGANVGNQFSLQDNWFVEPSAGVVYSQVTVDPLLVPGNVFYVNGGSVPPIGIQIQDFDSTLGRASLRFGKNIIVDQFALQPFFTASVFHEFSGTVRTTIATGFDAITTAAGFPPGLLLSLDSVADVRSRRIGTYEQLAVGIAGQLLDTGWLGYARFDYRLGERVDGYQVSGGLRYQFSPEAGPPLIRKGDAPSVLPALSIPVHWTGLSAGVSFGGIFGQTFARDDFGTVNPHTAGVLAGGQVGVDYQVGQIVFGAAGDFAWTNARGGRACAGGLGLFLSCESNTDSVLMATGRAGMTWDRALFYAKGGAAFADVSASLHDNTGGQPIVGGGSFAGATGTARDSLAGYAVGAGFEFALTQNWSAKAEYMHYGFGRQALRFPANVPLANPRASYDGDLVRVGVNYRFNLDPGPVLAAKY